MTNSLKISLDDAPRRRYVKLEPNEDIKISLKIKMSQAKVDAAGYAIQDSDGKIVQSDVDIDEIAKTVQIPGTSKFLKPALTPNGLNTGLDYHIDNPYKDEPVYNPEWGERVLKGKEKILLQHALEYKHGREHNYYTNKLFNRVESSVNIQDLPFFLTPEACIPITGNVIHLDMDNILDEIRYHMARVAPEIARSYAELKQRPECIYYIVEDDTEYKVKTNEKRRMNKGASIVEELFAQAEDVICDLAKALGNDSGRITKDMAYGWLDDYYKGGEENYSQFIKYYNLYKSPVNRDQFFAAANLQRYVDSGIIRKGENNKYYWVMPETDLSSMKTYEWTGKDKVVTEFLTAPEYTAERELLESIYEAKKEH